MYITFFRSDERNMGVLNKSNSETFLRDKRQHPLPGAISGKRGTPIVMAASAYKTNSTVRGLKGVGRNVVSRDSNNQLNHSNSSDGTNYGFGFLIIGRYIHCNVTNHFSL